FHANRPRPSPAVSVKLLDAASITAERFSEHVRATSGALGQSRACLLRRALARLSCAGISRISGACSARLSKGDGHCRKVGSVDHAWNAEQPTEGLLRFVGALSPVQF